MSAPPNVLLRATSAKAGGATPRLARRGHSSQGANQMAMPRITAAVQTTAMAALFAPGAGNGSVTSPSAPEPAKNTPARRPESRCRRRGPSSANGPAVPADPGRVAVGARVGCRPQAHHQCLLLESQAGCGTRTRRIRGHLSLTVAAGCFCLGKMSTTVRITVNRSDARKGEGFGRKREEEGEGDRGEGAGAGEGRRDGKARGPSAPPMDGGPERPRFKPSSTWGRSYAAMRELS